MTDKTYDMAITIMIGGCGSMQGEQEVKVKYTFSPGTPDVTYLKNGDPGYPGYPSEVEILSMTAPDEIGVIAKVPWWFEAAASEYVEDYILENHDAENPEPEREWERDVEDMHKGDET